MGNTTLIKPLTKKRKTRRELEAEREAEYQKQVAGPALGMDDVKQQPAIEKTSITTIEAPLGQKIEQVLLGGDLSELTVEERLSYYNKVCKSLGLNPLTRPFAYIQLGGKLVLYALKDCTEQLRTIHGVSVTKLNHQHFLEMGMYSVTAEGMNGDGRMDAATGVVTIANLKGDSLANAMMKAETKAKRRLTLSICGLGMLDETEIETIPEAAEASGVVVEEKPEIKKTWGDELWAKAKDNGKTGKDVQEYLKTLGVTKLSEVPEAKKADAMKWAENGK